jgi:hypothetical protein
LSASREIGETLVVGGVGWVHGALRSMGVNQFRPGNVSAPPAAKMIMAASSQMDILRVSLL